MSFLIPLSALILGILLGSYLDGPIWGFIPVILAVCFYLFMLRKIRIPFYSVRFNSLHSIWIFLLFMGIGLFTAWYHSPMTIDASLLNKIKGGEGEVCDVKSLASGDKLEVEISRLIDETGKIIDCNNLKVIINTDGFSTKKGDIILFKGGLRPIADNPNYRSNGYADRMNRSGYLYQFDVESDHIKIKKFSNSILARSSLWRDRIEIALEKSSLDRETTDFLVAFLLGDKSFISSDLRDSFSNTGVAHILALSGMHVAIVMGIFMALLFPLSFIGWYKIKYIIAIGCIWGFAFLTGLSPSTVRACVMASFVVVSLLTQRRRNSGNALLAASFIIILLDPSAIYDVGLQLSFLCVACILMFASQFNSVNRHLHPKLHMFVSGVLVSLVATIGTWVLVSYYFKRIPLLFLPTNLIILPLLPLYMSVAMIYVGLLLFNIDIHLLAMILDGGYSLFISVINFVESFGSHTLEFQATFPVVLLWIVGILILGYAISKKKRFAAILISCVILGGSVVAAPFLTTTAPDSIIFQKNFRDISMALYDGDNERLSQFPRNAVSHLTHKGAEIFSIDCTGFRDSIPLWLSKGEETIYKYSRENKRKKLKRYLLLGSGIGDISLSDIPEIEKFEKIILHSSIKKNSEKKLIEESKRLKLKNLHSLRLDGPLEVEM